MKLVSPLLKRVVYPLASKSGYLYRKPGIAPVVLTYHGILPQGYEPHSLALDGHLVTRESFIQHLRLLRTKYNLISPREFLRWLKGEGTCPPGSVLLTCDDGLRNVLTEMLPILKEMNLEILLFLTGQSATENASMLWYEKVYLWLQQGRSPATVALPEMAKPIFVHSRDADRQWRSLIRELSQYSAETRERILWKMRTQLGIPEGWESEYSQEESSRRRFFVVNTAEVKELVRESVTIGAHTVSHPMLSKMPLELAYAEISDSRARIQAFTGESAWAFAYPFGDAESVTRRELGLARRAGFECAFVNTEFPCDQSQFAVPRIHVSFNTTVSELEAHVSGFYRRIRTLA